MKEYAAVAADPPVGSFEEATRFQLLVSLKLTHAERLQELEAMWDFNDMVEANNPSVRRVAERMRERNR